MARRGEAPGVRFASRYPVVWLVPAAICVGIGYAYAAGLAGSWSDIHGAKAMAVYAGAALAIALVIAAVIGYRQGATILLVVPAVVLVVGFVITRPQVTPPAVGPMGKVTTPFETAVFALCSVLWFLSALVFVGMVPRMWRARRAFSRHDRSLHITRAAHWNEASATPIPLTEWLQFAEPRDDMTAYDPRDPLAGGGLDGKAARRLTVKERQLRASQQLIATRPDLIARDPDLARFVPPGLVHTFAYQRGDGSRLYLTWFNGEIVIAGVGKDRAGDVARMQPIAWSLGAHLVDDDGKVYEHA